MKNPSNSLYDAKEIIYNKRKKIYKKYKRTRRKKGGTLTFNKKIHIIFMYLNKSDKNYMYNLVRFTLKNKMMKKSYGVRRIIKTLLKHKSHCLFNRELVMSIELSRMYEKIGEKSFFSYDKRILLDYFCYTLIKPRG